VLACKAELPDRAEFPASGLGDGPPVPGRLILPRVPAEAAAAMREGLGGRSEAARQRRPAAWLLLLAMLDTFVPASEILALHRLRWRAELTFKRLKSQLQLDDLQAKGPGLARAPPPAKLLLAALADRVLAEALALSPSRPGPAAFPLAAPALGPHRSPRGAARRTPAGNLTPASGGSAASRTSHGDGDAPGWSSRGGSHPSADGADRHTAVGSSARPSHTAGADESGIEELSQPDAFALEGWWPGDPTRVVVPLQAINAPAGVEADRAPGLWARRAAAFRALWSALWDRPERRRSRLRPPSGTSAWPGERGSSARLAVGSGCRARPADPAP
jgi:hypothetical protein